MSERLTNLLARIEAATGPDREIDFSLRGMLSKAPSVVPPQYLRIGSDSPSTPTYTASIDAALALVERMLPEARLQLTRDPDFDGWWARFTDEPNSAQAASAPLAILAALLRSIEGGERG